MLSNYCKEIIDWYSIKIGGVKKFILNLCNKVKYVIYYKNLLYYLSLEIKLTKIYGILKFNQSNWLKIFTDFNTEKRNKKSR